MNCFCRARDCAQYLLLALAMLGCSADPERKPAGRESDEDESEASFVAPPTGTGSAASSSTALSSSASLAISAATASASASAPSAEPPPCPDDMVLSGRTCVDRFEAFLKRIEPDGSLVVHPYYERPAAGMRYAAANAEGQFPQAYISRNESKKACEEASKRLCSRWEWTRACQGKGASNYPYGHRGVRGACSSGKLHLLTLLFKNPPGGMKYEEHFNSPELNKTPDFLSRSGEHERCVSAVGAVDMVGNLHEWVSGTVDQDFMDKFEAESVTRRKQPWREGNGLFLGGFYSTTDEHGPGCSFTTVAHEPSYHDYSTGFRCCKDAVLPKRPEKPTGPGKKSVAPRPTPSVAAP